LKETDHTTSNACNGRYRKSYPSLYDIIQHICTFETAKREKERKGKGRENSFGRNQEGRHFEWFTNSDMS
jgi:hypothetical protein